MADKNRFVESVLDQIGAIDSREGIAGVSSQLLNALMNKERELFLREESDNKANGYYDRKLACALGNIGLSVPRDRNGGFRPTVIPELWQRSDDSLQELLFNLILQSYSPNKIKALLKGMNLPYSQEQIDELREELYIKAKELRSKELPDKTCCIFIDAYHTDIKEDETGRVKKAVIYTILGIDLEGNKDIYGYYIMPGSETKEDWLSIFNDLIARGLKRVLLVVSDDFSGLADAVAVLFSKSDHQLCYIHMQRNVRRNMSKPEAKDFNNELSILRKGKDFETAVAKFTELCQSYQKKYPTFINHLLKNKERYFAFMKYPQPVRKHLYTTNIVENFNSRIEVSRVNSGGYFQSAKTAEISVYVVIHKLKANRWGKPIPFFREALYELNQMFNTRFFGGDN